MAPNWDEKSGLRLVLDMTLTIGDRLRFFVDRGARAKRVRIYEWPRYINGDRCSM